uniref:Uncharacterized protein n=1 Tax=Cacopsylla melanoneura TaxID=428564 RepID=A0A8D9E7T5_9HEMI
MSNHGTSVPIPYYLLPTRLDKYLQSLTIAINKKMYKHTKPSDFTPSFQRTLLLCNFCSKFVQKHKLLLQLHDIHLLSSFLLFNFINYSFLLTSLDRIPFDPKMV